MTLDAATYPALLEENVKLRAERDALAAELARRDSGPTIEDKLADEDAELAECQALPYEEYRRRLQYGYGSLWRTRSIMAEAEVERLAAELTRLRTLEAAAIEWNRRREPFMRDPTMETAALIDVAVKALITAAREAEKARNV